MLAIGVFDGVHLGHQHLMQRVVQAARAANCRAAIMTFYPHPVELLRGISGRYYLTPLEERVRLIAAQGVDLVISHPFDEETRYTRAADFVERLDDALGLRGLWGSDFGLGYEREGSYAFLSALGSQKGFQVHLVEEKVMLRDERISSSRIRHALARGDVAEVNACLGRRFAVQGDVVQGQQRGRTIGFPTANLTVWEKQQLPAHGVYATLAEIDGRVYPAATNVGVRPTVNGHGVTVEAHLLDFDDDLYGKRVRLSFVAHVREEKKFDGLAALKAQISADIDTIRTILQSA
jgi:riboflavin kinase/FMN adenylyltransferase